MTKTYPIIHLSPGKAVAVDESKIPIGSFFLYRNVLLAKYDRNFVSNEYILKEAIKHIVASTFPIPGVPLIQGEIKPEDTELKLEFRILIKTGQTKPLPENENKVESFISGSEVSAEIKITTDLTGQKWVKKID